MKIIEKIKALILGRCPNCKSIGTLKVESNWSGWIVCGDCGYKERECGDW